MSGWTSAFALGDCKVKIIVVGSGPEVPEHEESLGLGDSFEFEAFEATYTVAVSEAGEVSVDGSNGYDGNNLEIQVIPQFDHTGFPDRIVDASFDAEENAPHSALGAVSHNVGGHIDFDSTNPAVPDPMVLTELPGAHDFISVYAEPGA